MTRTLTFQGSILRSEIDTTFENLNFRLLNSPDEIVWITVANVTDANRASHLELREKLFNIMLQSPYVKVVEFSFPKSLFLSRIFTSSMFGGAGTRSTGSTTLRWSC